MKFNNKVKFESDIMAYLLICGVLSDDDINAICKHHNIKISEKDKKDIIKELGIYYDGKNYSRYDFPELSKGFFKNKSHNLISPWSNNNTPFF